MEIPFNMKLKKHIEFNSNWRDGNMWGDFSIECPCGRTPSVDTFDEDNDDKLKCECGAIYSLQSTTTVIKEK